MKTFLKIVVGFVAFIVIVVAAVFFLTKDMVKVADGFFQALQEQNLEEASQFLSEEFKKTTSREQIDAFAKENSFYEYTGSSWSSRSFDGGNGEISGSITTRDEGNIPLTIQFVKEDGEWRIYHITKPSAGISEETVTLEVPPEDELVEMVRATAALFADAINAKDMQAFYDQSSSIWKQQITPEKLEEAFAVFMENEVDLTGANDVPPQFKSAPSIDENGILRISGLFPTTPDQVHFKQSYIFEGLSWKLFGINVNIE